MRHQSARVVFAACLVAAFSAAQAPSTLRNFDASDLTGAGLSTGGSSGTDIGRERWSLPRFDTSAVTQDPDYSMRGMFQQAHGTFMAGKERYKPMASVHLAVYPNMRINKEPGAFDMVAHGFEADVPFVLSTEGYLLLGAYYRARHYSFNSQTTLADETVHAVGMKFGFGAFLDEDFLLEVQTEPGAFTDADGGLHHNDFDFPSHALVSYRAAEHLFWKFGLRYNQVYEDAPWLPYFGVSWNITGMMNPPGAADYGSDSWRLDVLLPEYIELSYWPTGDTGFLWGADVDGAEYHVRTSQSTGRQRDNLRVQEVTTHLGFVHRFSDNLSLTAKAGAVLAGDHDLTNGFNGFNKIDGAADQGFFAHVTFGVDW